MEYLNVEELDEQVRVETVGRHGQTLDSLEHLFNVYLEGFRMIGQFTITGANDRELVSFLILTRSFNAMRWSFHLLKHGYYTQAVVLLRAVYEDWLVCIDCIKHPETVRAALGKGGHITTVGRMKNRLGGPFAKMWERPGGTESTYSVLSSIAHPSRRNIGMLTDLDTSTLRLGAYYDVRHFVFAAHYLATAEINMAFVLAGLTDDTWAKEVLIPAVGEMKDSREVLEASAQQLLVE